MENNSTSHARYTHIMLLILACVLLFASVAGYFLFQQIQSSTPQGGNITPQGTPQSPISNLLSPTPTLIPYPTNGSFTLTEEGGRTSVPLGTSFTINLTATSTDTVAGYDVILSYDETAFHRQSVQNKLDSFRIFPYDRSTHLSLSATKNLQVSTPIRFTNTPILSLTFTPEKKGTYTFSLKAVGNESSKLVNESAQVTYPQSADFRIEIN